jgi:hypothetical protein
VHVWCQRCMPKVGAKTLLSRVTSAERICSTVSSERSAMVINDEARQSIVVLRDRDPAAVRHPDPRMFGGRDPVAYVHVRDARAIPQAGHYVFNLEELDDASREHACRARDHGATVTFIVKHVDDAAAAFLAGTTFNVLPAYGDTEHIGVSTLRRALRMACDGVHVAARGFLANSGPDSMHRSERAPNPFVRLLHGISQEARQDESVVAAVLAPHRTGSQWLRDLIGWTVASDVRVLHEHAVPRETEPWPAARSLPDALAREPNPDRHRIMRRAALRSALLSARRRYIFVTYRDPVDRLMSYFVKRHSQFLRERLDAATQAFLDPGEIQCVFDRWLPEQVKSHSRWCRTTLFDHFGLDVCRAEPTEDGLLVARHAPNTLVIVPIEQLNAIRDAVEAEYGIDTCAPLADDAAVARGDGPISAAFRRDVHVSSVVANALRSIREVAYIRAQFHNRSHAIPSLGGKRLSLVSCPVTR